MRIVKQIFKNSILITLTTWNSGTLTALSNSNANILHRALSHSVWQFKSCTWFATKEPLVHNVIHTDIFITLLSSFNSRGLTWCALADKPRSGCIRILRGVLNLCFRTLDLATCNLEKTVSSENSFIVEDHGVEHKKPDDKWARKSVQIDSILRLDAADRLSAVYHSP